MCMPAIKAALVFFVCFSLSAGNVFAQHKVGQWYKETSRNQQPVTASVFDLIASEKENEPITNLAIDENQLSTLLANKPALLNLSVPYKGKTITLNLAKVNVEGAEFSVMTDKGAVQPSHGVYYRGIVDNNELTIASVSFFVNDVMGMFATSEGNFTIGKRDDGTGNYCVFNTKELPALTSFNCSTAEPDGTVETPHYKTTGVGCKTVTVYFECDYQLYVDKGSNTTNVTNYVNGLFSQVSALYANENIDIQVSQIFVWTSTDPYAIYGTTSDVLNAFRSTKGSNYNGDLAHFLTTRNLGGGIAYVNVLCNKPYAFGVSMIYGSYSTVPTYSWTTEVVTHELGHNLGSPHTQSCSWTGGAIDNCYTPEGSCSPGPAPVNGGTIMSYCHLTSYGINFNNGFGPQPGNLIRSYVTNASCLTGTGAAPTGLSTSNITTNSATANWLQGTAGAQYTIEYKTAAASFYTSAGSTTNTSVNLSNLTPNTNYVWHVKNDCSGYSSDVSFTTPNITGGCSAPVSLSTSNVSQTGATLSWGAVGGAANYTVQYKQSSSSSWITWGTLTGTALSLSGLSSATTYNWQVKADCSPYSSITSFTTQSVPTGCQVPSALNTINITANSAVLSWAAVTGAQSYQVKFHKATQNNWTNYNNINGTSKSVTGLQPSTTYEWKISTKCNGSTSASSTVISFTTPASSIAGNEGQNITLYPNPATSSLNISVTGWNGENGTGEIYSMQGARVNTFTVNSGINNIDINGLATGAYILQIKKDGQETTTLKFMKANK